MESDKTEDKTENITQDVFEQAEYALKITIPKYIKNLLTLSGFDTGPVIATITEVDLKDVETFDKVELINNISVEQYSEYVGPLYENRAADFQIVQGHKRLILLLRDYFLKASKSYTDCSTMTEVEYIAPTSNKKQIRNIQSCLAGSGLENITENTNSSFSSSLGSISDINSGVLSLSNVNLTRSLIK